MKRLTVLVLAAACTFPATTGAASVGHGWITTCVRPAHPVCTTREAA